MSEGSALGVGKGKTGIENGLGGPAFWAGLAQCWCVRGRGFISANRVHSLRNDRAVIGGPGGGRAVAVVSALAVGRRLQLIA